MKKENKGLVLPEIAVNEVKRFKELTKIVSNKFIMTETEIKPNWTMKVYVKILFLNESEKDYFLKHKYAEITGEYEITIVKDAELNIKDN